MITRDDTYQANGSWISDSPAPPRGWYGRWRAFWSVETSFTRGRLAWLMYIAVLLLLHILFWEPMKSVRVKTLESRVQQLETQVQELHLLQQERAR